MLAPGGFFPYNEEVSTHQRRLFRVHILITNDDGIYSVGLKALAEAAIARGHKVTISAPSSQCSTS